jgi:formylglycine-generating enzyme required for sulfatase activity
VGTGKYSNNPGVLAGYRDDYPGTAPVGSFQPNQFGLFDVGGNVQEWCEDWFDEKHERRVLRGSSYDLSTQIHLSVPARSHNAPGTRVSGYGFRVVLGPAS